MENLRCINSAVNEIMIKQSREARNVLIVYSDHVTDNFRVNVHSAVP